MNLRLIEIIDLIGLIKFILVIKIKQDFWTCARYLRVFRLNPKNKRDHQGAQASFRLEKHFKEMK
jgi:hypothetical protein